MLFFWSFRPTEWHMWSKQFVSTLLTLRTQTNFDFCLVENSQTGPEWWTGNVHNKQSGGLSLDDRTVHLSDQLQHLIADDYLHSASGTVTTPLNIVQCVPSFRQSVCLSPQSYTVYVFQLSIFHLVLSPQFLCHFFVFGLFLFRLPPSESVSRSTFIKLSSLHLDLPLSSVCVLGSKNPKT